VVKDPSAVLLDFGGFRQYAATQRSNVYRGLNEPSKFFTYIRMMAIMVSVIIVSIFIMTVIAVFCHHYRYYHYFRCTSHDHLSNPSAEVAKKKRSQAVKKTLKPKKK
jgi:hypothetical protein